MADQTQGDTPTEPTVPVTASPEITATPSAAAPGAPETPARTETPAAPAEAAQPSGETAPAADLDVVPETYAIKVGDQEVHASTIAALTPILKEKGFTAKQAQLLADSFAQSQEAVLAARKTRDLEAVRNDPELGGLKFVRTERRVQAALAQFTTQAQRDSLSKKGLVNDPDLVRIFHNIGKEMEEAPYTDAGSRTRVAPGTAQKLYGGGDRRESGRA